MTKSSVTCIRRTHLPHSQSTLPTPSLNLRSTHFLSTHSLSTPLLTTHHHSTLSQPIFSECTYSQPTLSQPSLNPPATVGGLKTGSDQFTTPRRSRTPGGMGMMSGQHSGGDDGGGLELSDVNWDDEDEEEGWDVGNNLVLI